MAAGREIIPLRPHRTKDTGHDLSRVAAGLPVPVVIDEQAPRPPHPFADPKIRAVLRERRQRRSAR